MVIKDKIRLQAYPLKSKMTVLFIIFIWTQVIEFDMRNPENGYGVKYINEPMRRQFCYELSQLIQLRIDIQWNWIYQQLSY